MTNSAAVSSDWAATKLVRPRGPAGELAPAVGDPGPDFRTRNQHGETVTLSQARAQT